MSQLIVEFVTPGSSIGWISKTMQRGFPELCCDNRATRCLVLEKVTGLDSVTHCFFKVHLLYIYIVPCSGMYFL